MKKICLHPIYAYLTMIHATFVKISDKKRCTYAFIIYFPCEEISLCEIVYDKYYN